MAMLQTFKTKWLQKLTDGSYKRERYNLGSSSGNAERCVMGVARAVAEEMGMLPESSVTDRHYLTDEELQVIGLSKDDQLHLASLNDTYIAREGKFPQRAINAIQALPIKMEKGNKPKLLTVDR